MSLNIFLELESFIVMYFSLVTNKLFFYQFYGINQVNILCCCWCCCLSNSIHFAMMLTGCGSSVGRAPVSCASGAENDLRVQHILLWTNFPTSPNSSRVKVVSYWKKNRH